MMISRLERGRTVLGLFLVGAVLIVAFYGLLGRTIPIHILYEAAAPNAVSIPPRYYVNGVWVKRFSDDQDA